MNEITYREDLDLTSMVDDIAKRIQDEVDQQALDKAAATLAKFGYEKVVRCRDCCHKRRSWNGHEPNFIGNWFCSYTGGHEVKPDGFCAWGERREQ